MRIAFLVVALLACQITKIEMPRAMDVPAIQEIKLGTDPIVLRDPNNCVDGWTENVLYGNRCVSRKIWSCEDESRILLTAENGTRHCVKF